MVGRKRYSKGTIGLVIFAVMMTPFLVGLGFWQLGRADEKNTLIKQQLEGSQAENVALTRLNAVDWQDPETAKIWNYKKIETSGRFDNNVYLLLDNRTRNGKVGYEVINLFKTNDGKAVWVNRGWIKAPLYRDQWPSVESVAAEVTIIGLVYFKLNEHFTLADNPDNQTWPRRVQRLDIDALEAELKQDIYPFRLRLIDDHQSGALKTGWRISQMSPDKHFGYALQWFSLALVLMVMTLVAIRKNHTTEVELTHDT